MKKLIWFLLVLSGLFYACTDDSMNDDMNGEVERFDIEYSFDNVTYNYTDLVVQDNDDQISGVGHYAEFTSIAGSIVQSSNSIRCNFSGDVILGKEVSGYMKVDFNQSNSVNIDIDQERISGGLITQGTKENFRIIANGINLSNKYTDNETGKEVSEYMVSGGSACDRTTNLQYKELTTDYKNELFMRGCGSSAYIKVKVYYK